MEFTAPRIERRRKKWSAGGPADCLVELRHAAQAAWRSRLKSLAACEQLYQLRVLHEECVFCCVDSGDVVGGCGAQHGPCPGSAAAAARLGAQIGFHASVHGQEWQPGGPQDPDGLEDLAGHG